MVIPSLLGKYLPCNFFCLLLKMDKKWCKTLCVVPLALAFVVAGLLSVSAANRSADPSAFAEITNGTLVWNWSNIPSGDEIDDWFVQFRPFGSNSTWIDVASGEGIQVEGYIIPDEQYKTGNSFRVYFSLASDGSFYASNVVSVDVGDVHFTLSINDIGVVSWTPVYAPVTLHFRWLNNWVVDNSFLQQPAGSKVFGQYITEYNTIQNSGYINSYNTQLSRTLEIYATCIIRGVTYTSNTVYRLGSDVIDNASIVPDSDITTPLVHDVDTHIGLLYRGVTHSKIKVYFLTSVLVMLPVVGASFILKHW